MVYRFPCRVRRGPQNPKRELEAGTGGTYPHRFASASSEWLNLLVPSDEVRRKCALGCRKRWVGPYAGALPRAMVSCPSRPGRMDAHEKATTSILHPGGGDDRPRSLPGSNGVLVACGR
jgi:hypothetical protein